ncbi:MAG: transcription antitermination factor NusB [Actinomycetes bacterium]
MSNGEKGRSGGKPKPDASRLLAFDLISQVNREGAFANIRLPELLRASELEQRDRAFVTELSYGTLRMQGKHDFAIRAKIDRPFEELDPKIVDLLRMGIHQIFEMRVPLHAAVSETVELARKVVGESKGSYVNALLRSISSDELIYENLASDPKISDLQKMSVLYSHPEWIISAFHDQLRNWDAVKELLQANNLPAKPNIVVWPGKSTVAEILETGGSVLALSDYGVESDHLPNEYPAIRDKRAGIQDVGSQLVTEIFYATRDLGNGESWLDLCAGPGGKAALLYNLLLNDGSNSDFLANEPTAHRAELVARVIPRDRIVEFDGRDNKSFGRSFDRILIDAPCTGLGALRRRPEARWRKTLQDLKELVPLQRALIDSAYEMLEPGGVIGYATCSPHLAETTAQVLDAQHRHKDLQVLDISKISPRGSTGVKADGTLQLWTHLNQSDAMFLALLRKPL